MLQLGLTAGGSGGGGGGSSNNVLASAAAATGGGGGAGYARKGQVAHCPDREWFGFGLLWQFIQVGRIRVFVLLGIRLMMNRSILPPRCVRLQDDKEVHEGSTLATDLTAQAIGHMVALLDEPECAGEREALLHKCVRNLRQHRWVA